MDLQSQEQLLPVDVALVTNQIPRRPWHLSGTYKAHQTYSPNIFFFYYDYTGTSIIVSVQFSYKDGKGTVVDELGRFKPMDYIVDREQYRLEALSSSTQHLPQLCQE
ncbi:hypothetical protein F4703DRAFT_1923557 [Phycomyces blakesleeanus]